MSYITDTSTPASKVIHLDSAHASNTFHKDEDGNPITSNFVYDMREAIVCPEHLSMICSLHTATIPYSFYNVRNNVNNDIILQYTNNSGPNNFVGFYKIQFPSGSYSALSFINTFQNILQGDQGYLENPWATQGGADLYRIYYKTTLEQSSWNALTGGLNPFLSNFNGKTKTTINGILDRVRLRYHLWESTDPNEDNTINILWGNSESTARDLFGFRENAPTKITYSADATQYLASDKVIDMNDEIHGLYLRTSLTTDGTLNSETGTFTNILARVSINTNFGGVIFHTPNNSSHKLQTTLPIIKFIGVKLTDDKNRILDLNGLNFQISIQIDFVPRLTSLQGATKSQRRAGQQAYQQAQARIESKAKGIELQDVQSVQNTPKNPKKPSKRGRPQNKI